MMQRDNADIVILGGGLSGGLLALALAQARPDVDVRVIEAAPRCGGNHIWSFFASDLSAEGRELVEPLVAARWRRYEVRFPREMRLLGSPYRSLTGETLDAALRETLPDGALITGATVTGATADSVTCHISAGISANGHATEPGERVIRAGAVIDARGLTTFPHLAGGWQTFLGRMVRLERPHGLAHPVLMDARVKQPDAFRFVYCLPFSSDTLFIEDTYYASTPAIDRAVLGRRIEEYCQMHGWQVAEVLREETGALPVVASGDFAAFRAAGEAEQHEQGRYQQERSGQGQSQHGPARIGVRAGLFHPLTGYSLPLAVTTALTIASMPELTAAAIAAASERLATDNWRRSAYYRGLARMMFGAAMPRRRYKLFEHFYRLSPGLIERFYAGRLTLLDRARVLIGRPPVPVWPALASLLGGHGLAPLDRSDWAADAAPAGIPAPGAAPEAGYPA